MTHIKICGLTREEDVALAIGLGAQMLGFIHVPGTPRFVDVPHLKRLLAEVGGRAQTVIVVQDASPETLDALEDALPFDQFQFHGDEPPEILEKRRGYKVIHMRNERPDPDLLAAYGTPFLLDTRVGGRKGGTGKTFDWTILPEIEGEFLVAGGLNPDNVAELVSRYRPWGIDVSSGVESAPGIKDPHKLKRFIEQTRSVSAL